MTVPRNIYLIAVCGSALETHLNNIKALQKSSFKNVFKLQIIYIKKLWATKRLQYFHVIGQKTLKKFNNFLTKTMYMRGFG